MSTAESEIGAIAKLLRNEGIVSQEQLVFAQRIRSKLTEERPLLSVLQELEYVDDGQIRATLRKHRPDVRLGDLLVELSILDPPRTCSRPSICRLRIPAARRRSARYSSNTISSVNRR